jgi:hypothetical protein
LCSSSRKLVFLRSASASSSRSDVGQRCMLNELFLRYGESKEKLNDSPGNPLLKY